MAHDARISSALVNHPKTKKLRRRLGPGACWSLVALFAYASEHRWDGDLTGMSDEDIGIAADWDGTPEEFCEALKGVGFLEGESSSYLIHDWSDHQPYAASRDIRSEAARKAVNKRWEYAGNTARIRPEYASDTPNQTNPIQSKPKTHAPTFDDRSKPLSESDCGIAICASLSFSGLKIPREVAEAVPIIRDSLGLTDNWQVFDFLPAKWRAYESSTQAKYRMKFETWLSNAKWKDGEQPRVNGKPKKIETPYERAQRELREACQ